MTILREKHDLACTCSFCKDLQGWRTPYGSWGYWQPTCWANNAWRTLWYIGKHHTHYIRWTMPRTFYHYCYSATCEGCTIGRERENERIALQAPESEL